jgi:hypothetical protein
MKANAFRLEISLEHFRAELDAGSRRENAIKQKAGWAPAGAPEPRI